MIYGKPRGGEGVGGEGKLPPRAGVLGVGNLCAPKIRYGISHGLLSIVACLGLPNWASLWAILKNLPTLRAFVLYVVCGLYGQNGSFT